MADNTFRSYRNRDEAASDGDGVPARGPADPLAQLARLIGQNDPRNEFDRNVLADAAAPRLAGRRTLRRTRAKSANRITPTQGYDERQGYDRARYDERYDPPRLAEAAGALSWRTPVARWRLSSASPAAIKQRAR